VSLDPVVAQETYRYGEHPDQVLDFWHPDEPSDRLVILLHGGFWRPEYDRTHLSGLAALIASGGASTALVEYRRGGGGFPATFEDVATGIDAACAIRKAREVVLVGHSAGGQLALWAAARDSRTSRPRSAIAAVVAIAPVSDLAGARAQGLGNGAVADFLGPADPPGTDPALLTVDVPTTLIHGRRDVWVPFEMSERFVAAAGGKAQLIALDVGHYEPIDPAEPAAKITMQTVLG
jgi:acetyl esterase/lipase